MAHVLVAGGAAMLEQVSMFLASKGNVVTVVSANIDEIKPNLNSLSSAGRFNLLTLDLNNPEAIQEALEKTVQIHGNFNLALCWIFSIPTDARMQIADFLNSHSPVCRLFEIMGSDSVYQEKMVETREMNYKNYDRVLYRKIILGTVEQEGRSRWLTAGEISDGTIHALRDDVREHIIGTVGPNESQPKSA